MRLEWLPVILGVAFGLIGVLLVFDAWAPDDIVVSRERRRRPRRERDHFGEALVGLGVLCMAGAFMGQDTWRYSTVAVIAGTVLLLWGAKRNIAYLRSVVSRRSGASEVDEPRRIR